MAMSFTKELKNHWKVFAILTLTYFAATTLFFIGERGANPDLSIWDAFWYGLVTLSTVGYGDFFPESMLGRLAGVVLIILAVSIVGYVISLISGEVVEAKRKEALGMNGTDFENHVVIFGWNTIARVTAEELLKVNKKVAVICHTPEEVDLIKAIGPRDNLFVTYGDASDHSVQSRVNVNKARTVVTALKDDSLNLIVSLMVKKRNPRASIVAAIGREELRESFESAGVMYVASHYELGGRLVASAVFEPEVAKFIEDSTTALEGVDLQQFTVVENSPLKGKNVASARNELVGKTGTLLVAVSKKTKDGYQQYPNPKGDIPIVEGDVVVLLGDDDQFAKCVDYLKTSQGV